MSPRSEELLEVARRRARTARVALDDGDLGASASLACYAMLYAARAALSEADESARTHRGDWGRFRERFVVGEKFDPDLFRRAHAAQREREQADYDGAEPAKDEAS